MTATADGDGLGGMRILVVEDEFLVARNLRRMLRRAGATVAGPVASAATARETLAAGPVDVVLLDVALADGDGYALADELVARTQPFAFVTGYDRAVIPERFRTVPWLGKPFSRPAIERTVRVALTGNALDDRRDTRA